MICTKQQLINGITEFINEDMIPNIQDKPLKMALYAILQFPGMIDQIIEKSTVKIFLEENEGNFSLDHAISAIGNTMDKFGSFPISIKAIPFILPSDVQISLNRSDLDSLVRHIERAVNYG